MVDFITQQSDYSYLSQISSKNAACSGKHLLVRNVVIKCEGARLVFLNKIAKVLTGGYSAIFCFLWDSLGGNVKGTFFEYFQSN